jgi:peptide/nickel transport system substrate-binding protein
MISAVLGRGRRRIASAAAFCGLALLASPALSAETTLVIGAAGFPDSLSTGISSFAALNLAYQTMDPLVLRDDIGNLKPGLATSWESVDATTWRFHLRRGVKFHDGAPFTAEDVKFTLDFIMNPKTIYGSRSRIGEVSGARVIDANTIEITTKAPFPTLPNGLSDIAIEPKHYHDKVGVAGMTARPLGTGAFKFGRWVPADRYELTANKEYWDGAPKIDRLLLRQIPEPSTRVAALLAGEAHIIEEVPVDLMPRIEASKSAKIASVESTVGLILTYDVRKAPFDNPKVRLALDYAVDKPLILREMLGGTGTLLQGQMLTSNTFGFNPGIKARPYDPTKAREILKEAGFPNGFSTSLTTRSGKYQSDVDISNAVAGMLAKIGVKTTVNVVEGGVFSKMATAQELGPIHMVGWYSLGDADFAAVWFTKEGKRTVWIDDEFERLFVEARTTVDGAKRLKAYHRMMEIMHEANPSMFLFGLPSVYGVSAKLTGFHPPSDKLLRLSKSAIQ